MKSYKILIVDDDSDWQKIMSDALLKAGYNTEIVATGEHALLEITKNDFDLVILDLRIPYSKDREATMRTGVEILKEIGKTLIGVPIITVSAFGATDVQAVADSVVGGASLFIEKGKISSELLKNAVAEILEKNLEKLILEKFPIPFAFIYREIKSGIEPLEKFIRLMNMLEIFLKFSAAILICSFYENIKKDEVFYTAFKTNITRPSVGEWFNLTKQMLKIKEGFRESMLGEKILSVFTKKK